MHNGIPDIEIGDWVEIHSGPSHFIGQIAEVVGTWPFPTYGENGYLSLEISFTPGYTHTNWRADQVVLLPRFQERQLAVEVLGEDYFD